MGNLLFLAPSFCSEGMLAGLVGTGVDVELEEATLRSRIGSLDREEREFMAREDGDACDRAPV